jgi:lipopolysaccharide export system permease protein
VRRIDRYLAREILLPFAAGLLFLTQLLLATQVLAQADVLLGVGATLPALLAVAADLVPHLLGYALPVAFLLGATLGVGRLAEDRELVALAAAGISPARLVRVPVLLGAGVAALALAASLWAEPAGLRDARLRVDALLRRNLAGGVRPGVFFGGVPGLTLYAEQVDGGRWRRVLISDQTGAGPPVLALASAGRLELDGAGQARLVLEQGELHRQETGAAAYVAATYREAALDLPVAEALSERNRLVGSPFELRPAEIAARAAAAEDPAAARRWRTFLHRRIAGPLAVLAFALLAVPLAALRRGGRAFGYAATLAAVVAYYALLRTGEGLSEAGTLPAWLGPNLPNAVTALAGIALTVRMARRGVGAVR